MQNKMYNLQGWLRDVRYALTTDTDECNQVILIMMDLLEEVLDGVFRHEVGRNEHESEDENMESSDDLDDMDGIGSGDGSDAGEGVQRPRPKRYRLVGGAAGLADPVPSRMQETPERGSNRSTPLARARGRKGVKRAKQK